MRTFGLARALAIAIVIVGAGVSWDTSGAGAASKPESCSLLKAGEISAALSQPTSKGKASSVPAVCDWMLRATEARPIGSVHTLVQRGSAARASYNLASRYHVDDREPLTDFGKKAFYAPSLGTVWVLKDSSTVFYVQSVYPTGSPVDAASLRTALLRLADRVEARL